LVFWAAVVCVNPGAAQAKLRVAPKAFRDANPY
jgi:hypothetical protein